MKHLARAVVAVSLLIPAFACSSGQGGEEGLAVDDISSGIQGRISGTEGAGLVVRSTASRAGSKMGSLADGMIVKVACQVRGDTVDGNDVWDYIEAQRGFVSDAFVVTGYDGFVPGSKRCDGSAGDTGGGGQSPRPVDVEGPPIRGHVQSYAESACGNVGACQPSTYAGHHPSSDLALDILISDRYGSAPTDDFAFADRLAAHALKNQAKFGIWYVILRQRINYGAGWIAMEDRGSITQNHYDHVHVSFNP